MKKCPYCAEEIQDEAIICKHCGRDLSKDHPNVTPEKRRGIMQNIAMAEKNLASWERYIAEQTQLATRAGRQVTDGWIVVFIGLFLIPFFGLGLIMVFMGFIGAARQSEKRRTAENNQTRARKKIESLKGKIVELRTELAGL